MIIYDPKITGSFQINGSTISSVGEIDNLSGSVAALNNASSSYLLNTTDTLTGNLTVTGTLTAQEFHTEYTSASIVYSSGSTKFGDSSDDVHSFTGSVKISENVDINGTELTIGNSDTRLAENNLRFKSSGDAYIDHYTTNQSIRIRTSNASALDTEAIIITGGGNFLMGNTVVNPASGFADQTGIGLKYSTTTPTLEVSSDSVALNLNRTTTGGAGVIAELRSANNVVHSFGTANSYMLGNVGIGATSPGYKLDVTGQIRVNGSTNEQLILDYTTASGGFTWQSLRINGANKYRLVGNVDNSFAIYSDVLSAYPFKITSSGNVGIGTTSPAYNLDVNGSARVGNFLTFSTGTSIPSAAISYHTNGYLYIKGGGAGAAIGDDNFATSVYCIDNGNIEFNTAGTGTKMVINSSGNVGIGETSPSSLLHFSKQTTWGTLDNHIIKINNTGTGGDINQQHDMGSITWYSGNSTPTAGISAIRNVPASGNNIDLVFKTHSQSVGSPAEAMRIDSNGNVGIGAADPLRTLHVVGNLAVNAATTQYYGILLNGQGEGANPSMTIGDWHNASATIKWDSTGRALVLDTQYSTGAGTFKITGNDEATTFFTISNSGYVGIANTSPGSLLQIGESYQTTAGTNKKILANMGGYYSTNTGLQYQVLGFTGTTFDESDIFTQSTGEALKNFYIGLVADGGYFNANRFSVIGGGSEIMSFKPDSKNVGIGTTGPSEKLHVTGNIAAINNGNTGIVVRSTNTFPLFQLVKDGGATWNLEGGREGNAFGIYESGQGTRFVVEPGGNVGINRTSPLYKLHVEGDAGFNNIILSNSSTSTFGTMSKVYQDYTKRSFVLNHSFTYTGAGTYYFNLAFPNPGAYGYDLRLVTGRSGNYRNFGYIKHSGQLYWESDGDFAHYTSGTFDTISSYGGGMTASVNSAYGANNINDNSQGTLNWSYYIVRYAITFPDNTTGSDGWFRVHLDTFNYTGNTAYFVKD